LDAFGLGVHAQIYFCTEPHTFADRAIDFE
jgi:hypothetical protein